MEQTAEGVPGGAAGVGTVAVEAEAAGLGVEAGVGGEGKN